jgi:hypothetical protein
VKAARVKEAQASSPRIETTPLKPGEIKVELWTDQQFYKIGEPMGMNLFDTVREIKHRSRQFIYASPSKKLIIVRHGER